MTPWALVATTLDPWVTKTVSTHLDLIPVVSILLQHSGRVERGLRHHH